MESLGRHLEEAGCVVGTAWAEPLAGGPGTGVDENTPVTPASVIKVPVAQAVLNAIERRPRRP
jgi:beta-lactamase class A